MKTAPAMSGAMLAAIRGAAHVIEDPARLAAYAIDGVAPDALVRPGTAEEIAEVVKLACAEKLAIVPCGGGTKLSMGMPPTRYDLALDVTRLDKVVAYDPDDLTLTIEAGMGTEALMDLLGKSSQVLPLGGPFFRKATVGGTIASGVDTPARQMHGMPRDFVLGMEFVTGEGVIARSGGRVVKNVTGYDLHKLMMGALGTLGIITKISFRTFPKPANARTLVIRYGSAPSALELSRHVAQSVVRASSIEALSPGVADLFYGPAGSAPELGPLAGNVLTNDSWALAIGFVGSARVLDRCEREVRKMADANGAEAVFSLGSGDPFVRSPASWALLSGIFWRRMEFAAIALESSPATVILKGCVLPARMAEILAICEEEAGNASLRWAAMARAAGVAYIALLPESGNEDARKRVREAAERIQAACEAAGGHATIPWCPAQWKNGLKIWGKERADWGHMKKVKAVFDPQEVLSPGRFAGGI